MGAVDGDGHRARGEDAAFAVAGAGGGWGDGGDRAGGDAGGAVGAGGAGGAAAVRGAGGAGGGGRRVLRAVAGGGIAALGVGGGAASARYACAALVAVRRPAVVGAGAGGHRRPGDDGAGECGFGVRDCDEASAGQAGAGRCGGERSGAARARAGLRRTLDQPGARTPRGAVAGGASRPVRPAVDRPGPDRSRAARLQRSAVRHLWLRASVVSDGTAVASEAKRKEARPRCHVPARSGNTLTAPTRRTQEVLSDS